MKTALFVLPANLSGGAEKVLFNLVEEMSALGNWSVDVLVLAAESDPFYDFRSLRSVSIEFGRGRGQLGSEIFLLTRLSKKSYDFVFATHFRVNLFLSTVRKLGILKCKWLVTRESTFLLDRFIWPKSRLYSLGYGLYGGQDKVIAQTEYMAHSLHAVLPPRLRTRIRILANPINVESIRDQAQSYKPMQELKGPVIVWCGRLIDVKSPLTVVELLSKVHELGIKAHLVVMGAGPLEVRVKSYAKTLNVERFIIWMGHQKNPYAVFRSARVGIITSKVEGFPNVLLEMLTCGVRRVVATPCTDGLQDIPGVSVASGFSADELLPLLCDALNSDSDLSLEIEKELSRRSSRTFLENVLNSEKS